MNGNINTAAILNKKIVDIEKATSLSLADMTGAVAAIADPPHIAVPMPMRILVLPGSFK